MDIYIEYSINLVYGFLAFAFIWLNFSLVSSKRYLLIERLINNKSIAMIIRSVLILLVAVFIEQASSIKPHNLYSDWQTYVIFLSAIFLLSMPGLLFLIIKKYL